LCSRMRSRRASSAGVEPERARLQTCAAKFGLEAALLSHVLAQDRLFSRPNHDVGAASPRSATPGGSGENSGGVPLLSLRTKRRARSIASVSSAAIPASSIVGNLVIVAPSSAWAS
jgi:hypothetical protein